MWSFGALIGEVHRLTTIRLIDYAVLVLVNSSLPAEEAPDDWVSAPKVKQLLAGARIESSGLRYAGGWFLKVPSRDASSAAGFAFDEVDRRAARLLLGRGQKMVARRTAWVFGEMVPVAVERRGAVGPIRIKSIESEKRLFATQESNQIDAAFELLAQLDGSSALAVGAGWAAIESLLAGDGAKVDAADRLAALVTASFPRAELTSLASVQIREQTSFGKELDSLLSNRDRARLLESRVRNSAVLKFSSQADRAALARVSRLVEDPSNQLGEVFNYMCRAFRRFYRQRNLVLHWGKTNPVALAACLRTTTPLLAAGVDRIAHAWFANGVKSLHLASVAKARIELSSRPGRWLTDLLEEIPS